MTPKVFLGNTCGPLNSRKRGVKVSLGITELERDIQRETDRDRYVNAKYKITQHKNRGLTFPSSNLSLSSVMIRTLGGTRNTPTVDGPSFRSFDKIRKTKIQFL